MDRFYIVIAGSDGSGKETQSKLLLENLMNAGIKAKRIAFPNYDSLSSGPVKMYLGGEMGKNAEKVSPFVASLPFIVDRSVTMQKFNNEDNETEVIIFDRYVESNLMYQAVKIDNEKEREEFIKWELDLEFSKLKLPAPDVTIFLNMPLEVSAKLMEARGKLKTGGEKDIHEANAQFLRKSYDFALDLAKRFDWSVINCAKNSEPRAREDIAKDVYSLVMEKIYGKTSTIE